MPTIRLFILNSLYKLIDSTSKKKEENHVFSTNYKNCVGLFPTKINNNSKIISNIAHRKKKNYKHKISFGHVFIYKIFARFVTKVLPNGTCRKLLVAAISWTVVPRIANP